MPWRPEAPGDFPTLGWQVIDWMTTYLAQPDRVEYEPFIPYPEQEDFLLRFYELDPHTGARKIKRGLLGRPRGWGKSPFLAAMSCAEGLGPVRFGGWDAQGQPVGVPWVRERTPLVQIAATTETQVGNTWTPLLQMLRDGPAVDAYPGLDPLDTFVVLPRGRIEQITSSARSVKGARAVFGVLDQTEEWVKSNGGVALASKMRANAAKVGGSTVESPNAFIPGEGSVAEGSAATAAAILEGRAKLPSLLYDHREAPGSTELDDRESLTYGLRVAYGDSSGHPDGCVIHDPACPPGHVDLDDLIALIWDPQQDVQESRSDFLNQITHASDSWLSQPDWLSVSALQVENPPRPIEDGDTVVIGFDGSRKRARGVTDATAIIGCRVADGHLFQVRVWEQPEGPQGEAWEVPTSEVDAVVRETFKRYNVVGMYCDPAKWESWVTKWEATWGAKLKVKSSRDHPMYWWMTGGRATMTVRALEQFHTAVVEHELTHDGSSALHRHIINARRRDSRSGMQIAKEHPDSAKKIDAAVAAVLAWTARMDAVAAGLGQARRRRVIKRIR